MCDVVDLFLMGIGNIEVEDLIIVREQIDKELLKRGKVIL